MEYIYRALFQFLQALRALLHNTNQHSLILTHSYRSETATEGATCAGTHTFTQIHTDSQTVGRTIGSNLGLGILLTMLANCHSQN